jgi:hypothetical protein
MEPSEQHGKPLFPAFAAKADFVQSGPLFPAFAASQPNSGEVCTSWRFLLFAMPLSSY